MKKEAYSYIIPLDSPVRKALDKYTSESRILVISGLPGVGKSLYINELYHIIQDQGHSISLIQWDQARKAFETEEIFKHYPMGDGVVHNGLKLVAGAWLMDTIENWWKEHKDSNERLLIEAPLVGHRFIELAKPTDRCDLEDVLGSKKTAFIMPMPTKSIREAIELARMKDVDENAKVWFGAKPSVMKMLWELTCHIAVEMGYELDLKGPLDYDPEIYQFVFKHVLKHRNFCPLIIDELYNVKLNDEKGLHSLGSLMADESEANKYGLQIRAQFEALSSIDKITTNWYNT